MMHMCRCLENRLVNLVCVYAFGWPNDRKHRITRDVYWFRQEALRPVRRSYVFLSTNARVFAVGDYKQVAGVCSFSIWLKDQTPILMPSAPFYRPRSRG